MKIDACTDVDVQVVAASEADAAVRVERSVNQCTVVESHLVGHDLAWRPAFLAVVEGDHCAGLPWLLGIAAGITNDARAAAEAE